MINTRSTRLFYAFGLAVAASLAVSPLAGGEDNPYSPQPQASLEQMLSIEWQKGPSLPQGFQDGAGGIIDGVLVTACGFCGFQGATDVPGKPAKYPYGHIRKAWRLDLQSPQTGWQRLPDFPGVARQGVLSIVVNDRLYCWGGNDFTAPYTRSDGYRLSKSASGRWSWTRLPALPWPMISAGIAAIGSKIYVCGGADFDDPYDARIAKLYTATDRHGANKGLGAKLMVFDTDNIRAGWTQLSACPGTPRCYPALAAVDGRLYVFGGLTGNDNPSGQYCTVVDNWRYDPAADCWQRLADLPVASGNFPTGQIVAFDRYVLMVGGAQYDNVLGPDAVPKPIYGTPSKHYPAQGYWSDVFVYDVKLGKFGTATPLPLNNNLPMAVVSGDRIHLIGGEIGRATIEDEPFGHHPDLYLVGTIREAPESGTCSILTPRCGRGCCRMLGRGGSD